MKRMVVMMVGVLVFVVFGQAQDRVVEAGKVLAARPWISRHVSAGGVRLELRGLYMCGGLLWLVVRAENRSAINFRGNAMRFVMVDRHSMRREAVQEIAMEPVVSKGVGLLRADSSAVLCYGLMPRVPGRKRVLVMEWGERNGDRRMRIILKGKVVLKAKELK